MSLNVALWNPPTLKIPEREGYFDEDGEYRCKVCHKPLMTTKATRDIFKKYFGNDESKPCLCDCDEKDALDKNRMDDIEILRDQLSERMKEHRFECADDCDAIKKLKAYADAWPQMYKGNHGLLLIGPPGTGKTFGAECIINALIDMGINAKMIRASAIASTGDRSSFEDVLMDVREAPLLVIDDLGADHGSNFAKSRICEAIDERYQVKKPLIVTTNYTPAEIDNPEDRDLARIFDRLREMCIRLVFSGPSRRKEVGNQKLRELLNEIKS